jgi:hypothetical protein
VGGLFESLRVWLRGWTVRDEAVSRFGKLTVP